MMKAERVFEDAIERVKENSVPILCGFVASTAAALFWRYYKELEKRKLVLVDQKINWDHMDKVAQGEQAQHNYRRSLTYPPAVTNSWYHVLDSSELRSNSEVVQVKALNRVFAMWRTSDGKPVCQDAFCIHLGANLAVGGQIKDDCLTCPFHKWKFDQHGAIKEIPYIKDQSKCPTTKKLKTYPCMDWCGLVCVYIHKDGEDPAWFPPVFLQDTLTKENWAPYQKWDIGFKTLSPVDWVDQAGDYSHFTTLHGDFLIPYTTLPLPSWLMKVLPLSVNHELFTMKGDDPEWIEQHERTGWGNIDKHLIYFTDVASLRWNNKVMEQSKSETVEIFIGPAMMCFNIPFTIGSLKAFVTTTPVDGGSVMRVRTWADSRVMYESFFGWKKWLAWLIVGVSASQLQADIDIMCSKIRLRKPLLQPFDGPYNRVNQWLKQFYSNGDPASHNSSDPYGHDW